jgi:hypothetical protein
VRRGDAIQYQDSRGKGHVGEVTQLRTFTMAEIRLDCRTCRKSHVRRVVVGPQSFPEVLPDEVIAHPGREVHGNREGNDR